MTYEDEDVAMEVEYEQVASLDELVDIEEVDDLKLQLKGQVSAVDKSTVTSSLPINPYQRLSRYIAP